MKQPYSNKIIDISPEFQEEIAIVFAVDEKYLAYLAVALESFKAHCHTNYYDIIILELNLNNEQKKTILDNYINDRINIRFVNLEHEIANKEELSYINAYLTSAMYLRFFIPKILYKYQKVIYCDCDIIFFGDIAHLYSLELKGYLLGAVKDAENLRQHYIKSDFVSYCQNTLKLQNSLNYFQSGVLIFNIQQCLKEKLLEQCLQVLSELKTPIYPDQDVLNIVAENKILFLQGYWNVENHILAFNRNNLQNLSQNDLEQYEQDLENVKILHYSGDRKPWNCPTSPNAILWWSYARKTPFYEVIIYQNIFKDWQHHFMQPKCGAVHRVKNTLSYKLGNAIVKSTNPIKAIFLPLICLKIYFQYKLEKLFHKTLSNVDSSFTRIPLQNYADYSDSLKAKQHLSYQLGNALVTNPLKFPFIAFNIYKSFKKGKQ